jgi:NAD(P)-dependent dehydrogenase (short-subunit alcohol dehydrogenase family)
MVRPVSDRGWIFITGASTGIGRAAVERLTNDGYSVIAGVRRDGDQPAAATAHVLIDLADAEQIASATADVEQRCGGRLAGLVNNAGYTVAGPFEALEMAEWRRQFEVNFFGHLDVTRRLLPAVLAARGRIITTGSIGGRVAQQFLGPYQSSKFAIRAWNDTLRAELAPHGVKVILLEPGAIATEIWGKGNAQADDVLGRLTPELQQRYARQAAGARKIAATVEKNAIPAAKVADAISRAMSARRPRAHVIVGVDARVQAALGALPTAASDRIFAAAMRPPKGS